MHNGCTTALETLFIGKPLITYIPSKRKYQNNLPNKLGFQINSLKKLNEKVNFLFKKTLNQKIIHYIKEKSLN